MAYPLDDLPVSKPCPHCQANNYLWRVQCSSCGQRMLPALIGSGPIVLAALQDSVDDMPPGPGSKAYTLKVTRMGGIPEREPDYDYLASRVAAMYAGESSYGIGVDVLASNHPYLYGKAAIQRGLRG